MHMLSTWLVCAAQNMKNIAIKKEKVNGIPITSEQCERYFWLPLYLSL